MNQPDPQLQEYLEFRSGQVTRLIRMMRDHIQEIKPGTPISCNDFDPILRNSYLTYGIDLTELAKVQDVVMIENFGLPKWTTIPKPRLANNALTVRSARTLVKENAHLSVLSYDVGIGYDPVYSSRKFQQGIGEAAALGVTMTTKGTEYHDGQQMTLLTDRQYSDRHQAIGNYHRWLETHSDLYSNRKNHSPVGLVFPGKELWYRWHDLALDYFDVGQTLTYHGIPWQVIDPKTEINPAVNTLILVSGDSTAQIPSDFKGKIIYLNQLPAWGKHHSSRLTPDNWEFSLLTRGIKLGMNAYTVNRFSRWLFDKLNLPKIVTQSQFYLLPSQDKQSELLVQLPANIQPRVISNDPVLIDYWNQDGNLQIHMINYADSAQSIQVLLPWDGKSILITPDADGVMTFDSNPVTINLEIYAIISPE